MHVHIRAFCERAAGAEPGSPISFVASTSDLARDGMTIDANGWKLDNYRASPVVLWSHDYMGNRPPIGRADNVRVDGGKLMADITFDQGDPFARDVERKYREGFISAVSVGWDTLEFKPDDPNQPWNGGKVLSAELLDISAVNVPGDPKALIERQKRAYRDLGAELLRVADLTDESAPTAKQTTEPEPPETSDARASWPETQRQMVLLFEPFVQGPADAREAAYRRLVREYKRHGKEAPDLLTIAEVDALPIDQIRAHFLEGEGDTFADLFALMDKRAGAVLSQRNRDDLQTIADLATGILERARKEADQTDEGRALAQLRSIFSKDAA